MWWVDPSWEALWSHGYLENGASLLDDDKSPDLHKNGRS